jgi:DNA-binding transcriptional MocR family regulator
VRHCVKRRKVAGSILVAVGQNPTGRTMALGSTQRLNRNENREYSLEVKAAGA